MPGPAGSDLPSRACDQRADLVAVTGRRASFVIEGKLQPLFCDGSNVTRLSIVLLTGLAMALRELYEPGADGIGRFREAACWAHWRRDFHDIWTSNKSEIAPEALDRIGALYDIERDIAGQPADVRLSARQKHSKAKVSKHSASGLKRNWPVFRASAIWLKLSDMA